MANKSNLKNRVGLSVFLFVMAGLVQARTITIGPGVNYDFSAIQRGIDAAVDGDTVLVAPGEYVIAEPITFRGKAITVKSEVGPDETTIQMGTPADTNRGSVVIFENNETAASVLDGFTITGGRGFWVAAAQASGGGGILFDASSGTVRNCTILQNSAKHGGGVILYSGACTTLTNCTIAENLADDAGGGVFCYENSSMSMSDCIIMDNSAAGGGGVHCWVNSFVTATNCILSGNSSVGGLGAGAFCGGNNSSQKSFMTMTDCILSGNSSRTNGGGGVACWYGSLTLTRCAIVSNTAQDWFGGGVYAGHSSAALTNCIVTRNTAALSGGGVCSSYADAFVTINNCTIWGNSAGSECGGGVLCRNASMMVTNSIIWGNTSSKGNEISVEDSASQLTIAYSDVAGGQAEINVESGCTLDWSVGNIDADPLFARLGYVDENGTNDPLDDFWMNGGYRLKSEAGRWDPESQIWIQDNVTSPCIDAGDPMSPIGWESFPNGGFVNMGAYGGTPKASKSYFGEPICETIVAGDINGDGQVNRADLEIMALHWTDEEPLPLP